MVCCGHEVKKSAHGRLALVFAPAGPMDRHADHRPANDGQIQRRISMAHTAAVFSGDDVQALVQSVFDAPVVAIPTEHLLRIHLRRRARGQEELYFGFLGWLARNLDVAGEPGGLFGKGEADAAGTDFKSLKATLFGTPPVDLRASRRGTCVPRGKKRATGLDGVVARSFRRQADCL